VIFFTSDTHFDHANVIKYSNRPYKDVDEMNNMLINNWNSVVSPNDTVYHLGDVSFGSAERTDKIFNRLNGDIKLCYGNHDKLIKKTKTLQDRFSEIRDYYEIKVQTRNGGSNMIVLCHFPMVVWNRSHHGSWMLHGHCHGNLKYPMKARIMDVGVDPCNYFPISQPEVEQRLNKVIPDILDHHGSNNSSSE
jgi:calcineurin-like phosphoesterase family protein